MGSTCCRRPGKGNQTSSARERLSTRVSSGGWDYSVKVVRCWPSCTSSSGVSATGRCSCTWSRARSGRRWLCRSSRNQRCCSQIRSTPSICATNTTTIRLSLCPRRSRRQRRNCWPSKHLRTEAQPPQQAAAAAAAAEMLTGPNELRSGPGLARMQLRRGRRLRRRRQQTSRRRFGRRKRERVPAAAAAAATAAAAAQSMLVHVLLLLQL